MVVLPVVIYTEPLVFQLYKGAEEDVIQLYDLSILPEKHTAGDHRSPCGPMSSFMKKGRKESLFSLGKLLYRVAHRMSLSKVLESYLLYFACFLLIKQFFFTFCIYAFQVPSNKAKCAQFFRKCLDFLTEQDHLVFFLYDILQLFLVLV
jgi:hypothetical protein